MDGDTEAGMSAVQNNRGTTAGGVTGRGFAPGRSGNPGGRPKGLTRRVRELVGDDGDAIVCFMHQVMTNPNARTADRLEAGRWLGDRGFGRSVQPVDLDVNQHAAIDVTMLSTADLDALLAILDPYSPNVRDVAESGQIEIGRGDVDPAPRSRRR
jgi:hypothetical protein